MNETYADANIPPIAARAPIPDGLTPFTPLFCWFMLMMSYFSRVFVDVREQDNGRIGDDVVLRCE